MGWLSNIFGRRPATPAESPAQPAEAYLGLRGIALGLRDRQSGELGATADEPLAMLMEFHAGGGVVVTLVAVSTSLYFSTGGGIIGAGGHAPVAAATHAWLRQAVEFAPQMAPTGDFPPPRPAARASTWFSPAASSRPRPRKPTSATTATRSRRCTSAGTR